MSISRYDQIGDGYAAVRREDPRFAEAIEAALGDARTVVNVGAGAGSYEPRDRYVIAVEPSDVMAAQRTPDRVPALRGGAGSLPLRDGSVDAGWRSSRSTTGTPIASVACASCAGLLEARW